MKICPTCKSQFDDSFVFCSYDATPLVSMEEDVSFETSSSKRSRRSVYTDDEGGYDFVKIILAVLILAGICVGGYFIFKHFTKPVAPANAPAHIDTTVIAKPQQFISKGLKVLPDNFTSIYFPTAVVYLPVDFNPVEIPLTPSSTDKVSTEMVLMGTVTREKPVKHYFNVSVLKLKSAALKEITKDKVPLFLKEIFFGFWDSETLFGSKSLQREIQTLDYFQTFYGQLFLNVTFVTQPNDKASSKMFHNVGFFCVNDTVYVLGLSSPLNQKHYFDNDFDVILSTFNSPVDKLY